MHEGSETYSWDVRGWIGGDYERLWFKTQGDDRIDGPVETAEVQLRYSRLFHGLLGAGRGRAL